MPDFKSFREFHATLSKSIGLAETAKITRQMGLAGQVIASRAASADLGGDPKFSGWAPKLDTQLKTTPTGATIIMPTRSSAGPWTTAEFGRNQGNAKGFSGPGISIKTGLTSRTKSGGLRKVRARASRRWNGITDPKHTASDAIRQMEVALPKIAETGVRKVLQKNFDVT